MSMKNITKVYNHSTILNFNDSSKIVIMSDLHRGNGGYADSFSKNKNIFLVAISQYFKDGYTYIELGDGDELWKYKNFSQITSVYDDIFLHLQKFYAKNRFYMIFGNHDIEKSDKKWVEKNMTLFPNIQIHEGIILNHSKSRNKIFLIHGHQVDFLSYNLWKLSRLLVKYLWRPLVSLGINDPTSAANDFTKQNIIDKTLAKWSTKNKTMLIAGHTHRSVFPKDKDCLYFNDGCCVYPEYIKAIEIHKGKISLVQWSITAKEDGTLYIAKECLKSKNINDY